MVIAIVLAMHPAPSLSQANAQVATSEWPQILAAAKKEGAVRLYTAQVVAVAERIVAGFRKAYPGIAIEYARGPSGPMLTRLQQEMQAGLDGADVWISTEVSWDLDQAKAGTLVSAMGPSARDWPEKYVLQKTVTIAGIEPLTIYYNKNLVPDPPKGYQDLLRAEFKDRIGTSDLASTTLIAWYDWLEKTQGADYLLKLKAQNPKLYVGVTPLSQATVSGEIAVSAFGNPTAAKPLTDQGAPLVSVVPNSGLGIQYAMVVLGGSKRPNAAQVLADYILSSDGQAQWHGGGESASPGRTVPGALDVATITPWDVAAYPPDVVDKYKAHWNAIFK